MTKLRALAVLAALTVGPHLAEAQDWPSRPIHFIIPYAPGGSTDSAARVIADHVSRQLRQQIVIENRTGANGNLGIEVVAKSPPDGYTVLIATEAISGNPHVYKMAFEPLKALTPVVELSRQPIALAAHPSLGVNTLAELTALAKQQPGLRFGTGSGVGSTQAMVTLWYAKLAGITLEQVPYRGGGQAINDLIAGHVKLGSLGSTPLVPHYKSGAIKLLAQSMSTRSATLPDVPTYQEAGATGLVIDQRLGVLLPVGTPAEIATRLNAAINTALADDKVRKSFFDQALDVAGGTADSYARLLKEDSDKYARLVKELNVKAE